jgi:hypothetical protein
MNVVGVAEKAGGNRASWKERRRAKRLRDENSVVEKSLKGVSQTGVLAQLDMKSFFNFAETSRRLVSTEAAVTD